MSRINLNGTARSAKSKASPKPKAKPWHDGKLRFILGVILISTALNGWSGWHHGGAFGCIFMALIPWGVLQGSANAITDWNRCKRTKTAAPLYKQVPFWTMIGILLSIATALYISLSHCAATIQEFTGSTNHDAWLLAITIDIGLIAHEVSKAAK
jgi:hypothetical protein